MLLSSCRDTEGAGLTMPLLGEAEAYEYLRLQAVARARTLSQHPGCR